jgi:hypothetical protein
MRRIVVVLTMAAVILAMIATSGASASAQSSCPPTGPSDGPATILVADDSVGAGFVCLDEEAQEFFCPPGFELQLFPVLPPGPAFAAECVELSPFNGGGGNGGGSGGVDLLQEGEQAAEAGQIEQTYDVS